MMRSSYGVGHLTDRIEVTITVNHSLVGFRKAQWDEKVHDGAEGGINSRCVHDIGWLPLTCFFSYGFEGLRLSRGAVRKWSKEAAIDL